MKAAARLTLTLAIVAAGCGSDSAREEAARIKVLKTTYDQLHRRFNEVAAREPLAASASGESGEVTVAIRSGLIENLAGSIAQRYLDHVVVDLAGVRAHSKGAIHKKTFLGGMTIGEWRVDVEIGALAGNLHGGTPRVSLRPPDALRVRVPIDVQETTGTATLTFAWDSRALANIVCRDFRIVRPIRGRVLAQHREIAGAFRLRNTGETLTAEPLFPDRRVALRLDLSGPSWEALEADLQSQNTAATCGALVKRAEMMTFLKGLAATGIVIQLPKSIFRTVALPARFQESVQVNRKQVGLSLRALSLKVDERAVWSSVSVRVKGSGPDPV